MHASRILAVAAAAALASPLKAAQDPVYAIVRAKLVPVSGPVIAKGTLVLRGGTIEAVGSLVEAPPDARVMDGAGLVLTPGLIDGYGRLGLPAPKKPAKDAPAAEPIAPHRNALDRVQVADALKARDSGVTSALTIPIKY